MPTLSIIIPVYNEEKHILSVIKRVIDADTLGMKKEIIVVDDGSTDGTARKIENLRLDSPIQTILKKKNEGKGSALKTGFAKSTGDILMVQDADEEYSVADYPALLFPFVKDSTQVIYGSRNKKRGDYNTQYSYFSFYWGGLLLTWFINLLYGIHLTDQPTGYKLFSSKVKPLLLKPTENRFSYEVAITALLAKSGKTFIEIPIHYKPRTIGEGKKINAIDFIKSMMVAVKYAVSG